MDYSTHVIIEGEGVSRQVMVFNAITNELLATAYSDNNGEITVTIPDDTDSVLIVALDAIGDEFNLGVSYPLDKLVRPTIPNGFMYRVVVAGQTSTTTAPEWSTIEGVTVGSGDVVFVTVPHYRPVVRFVPL